jgi:acetyl esterase
MARITNHLQLDPTSQSFINGLEDGGRMHFHAGSVLETRAALATLQMGSVGKPTTRVAKHVFPVGPSGIVPVRIVRPANGAGPLPVVMYFHGGGWISGGADTHHRLICDIAAGTKAAVVFVEMTLAPEAQFPVALEEAYAAAKFVAEFGASLGLDGSRLAVAGDGTGGNIAASVALMAKDRRGPALAFQLLFYPVTDARFDSPSYFLFDEGPWLTAQDMKRFWDAYLPDPAARMVAIASPLNATTEALRGLPDTLIITAENDVLRDEGEAYARKLMDARVRVTASRYLGAMHDFVMLNALADTPAARGAIEQANAALKAALD